MARSLEEIAAAEGNELSVFSIRITSLDMDEKYALRAADTYLGENGEWILMRNPIVNPNIIEDPGV